jgi:hypothetical protein
MSASPRKLAAEREKITTRVEKFRSEIYFAGEPKDGLGFFAVNADGEPTEFYPTKAACRRAVEDGSAWCEQFALQPQPAIVAKRERFESVKTTQRVLITGLDCLPGQEDLFST